jgi:hypothetical protein
MDQDLIVHASCSWMNYIFSTWNELILGCDYHEDMFARLNTLLLIMRFPFASSLWMPNIDSPLILLPWFFQKSRRLSIMFYR